MICSDEECELTVEAVDHLDRLELLVCEECDCCLQLVSLSSFVAVELEAPPELALAA
ncbi:MAG TPA: hypothetical protein VGV10_00530 [Thermoleophilaceae bacterium]|nr:hypothetical protein [Thermoleophilaceae bacterium]